jgi:polysaccharide biosynthesis protein PelF
MHLLIDKKQEIDILLIAEGTYPFIRGGVSSWIHQLMQGLPHYSFGIVFLGSTKDDYGEVAYEFPDNLNYLLCSYLFGSDEKDPIKALKGKQSSIDDIKNLYEWFKKGNSGIPDNIKSLDFYSKKVNEQFFLYSEKSWEFITQKYEENCSDMPFIDYFWTVRNIHAPIWTLAKIAQKVVNVGKVIHTPSTGYAGFLAALLSVNANKPMLLTEHGIYTKERKIDLLSNDFFSYKKFDLFAKSDDNDYIKQMWVRFFEGIGRFCYNQADEIFSLFNEAKNVQIEYGAKKEICTVIPNGVAVERLDQAYQDRPKEKNNVITLIGRVVAIKDIKTFLRAIRITSLEIPDVQGWIVGPTDEDEEYYQECLDMVESFNLQKHIKFLGFQNIMEILPQSRLQTLSSISEGMPLVILEGFGAGVPCVATDVGSCKELIYGALNQEDIKLGKAGEIVNIADPSALAQAYVKLLTDDELWLSYQQTALARVKKFYTQNQFFQAYDAIYKKAMK